MTDQESIGNYLTKIQVVKLNERFAKRIF